MGEEEFQRMLSPGDVAYRLNVSLATVYRMIRDKRLRAFRMGRLWRIREDDVRELLIAPPQEEERCSSGSAPIRRGWG